MIYVLTSGSYSDYSITALVEGPDDVNMSKKYEEFVDQLTDLDILNNVSFERWLGTQPGWREINWGHYNTDDDDDYMWKRRNQFDNMFPDVQVHPYTENCPDFPYDSPFWRRHSWNRVINEDGRYVMECRWCKGEVRK